MEIRKGDCVDCHEAKPAGLGLLTGEIGVKLSFSRLSFKRGMSQGCS